MGLLLDIIMFCFVTLNILWLGKADIDVVRVAAATYEALAPDLNHMQEKIDLLKKDIFAKIDEGITKCVETAASKYLEILSHPDLALIFSASSCKEILQLFPQSPSGLYWLRGKDNRSQPMYCDMERDCKGVAGGWMRVASINMADNSSTCPSGLRTLTSPRRLCALNIRDAGCSSTVLSVQGVEYSQVCGKIIGYQQGSPDAFHGGTRAIDTNYVDGISITHGKSPRKHIWTFAAALHENYSKPRTVCPCTNTSIPLPPPTIPEFVGNYYFCDTASQKNYFQPIFYEDDPLWDGAGCGQNNTCCELNSPPWFRKEISPPTTDDIEIRMCIDQDISDEDINFETLEIYVQ